MKLETLKLQYDDNLARTHRMRETMVAELMKLLDSVPVTLGVPVESRVKEWPSVAEKLVRKGYELNEIKELDDLVGIRIILLFRHELDVVEKLILKTFQILRNEDTGERLGDSQFGYQSQHYILKLPTAWLTLPSMADLGEVKVELQVRTLAQHIWATASHKLQYKHEASVPPPLKRTINRVSALLEIVDLEFDRVVAERKDYRTAGIASTTGADPLNVDLLESVLADIFPAANRKELEDYEDLLAELKDLEIMNVDALKSLLYKHRTAVLEVDQALVARLREAGTHEGTTKERIDKGVFYAHAGLTRRALRLEFGEKADEVINEE